MKKILAGILASTTLLAMTVSASAATTKTVTAAGEQTYDVTIAAPKVVLNLIMPAKITAALNPYGAEIKLDEATPTPTTITNGIGSVAYSVTNQSTDYGVWIDATAVTTVNTADETAWTVKALESGKKGAELALVAGNAVADIKTLATGTFADIVDAKATDNSGTPKQGALRMDSTVAENATTGAAAGTTSQKKFMFVPAKNGSTDGVAYMALVGNLQNDVDTIEYTAEDSIGVSLVLKVSAGAKTIDGASTPSTPAYNGLTALSVTKNGTEQITGFNAATKTYTISGAAAFDTYTIAPTAVSGSTATMAAASGSFGGGAAGSFTAASGAVTIGNNLPASVTITVTDGGTNTDTYTVTFQS